MHLPYQPTEKWKYENGFYLTSEVSRIPKLLAHYELYKKIVDLPGHIIEFGVYKGVSLVQWLTFREILESPFSRKIIGFDAFGKFPDHTLALPSDRAFVKSFEAAGGDGLARPAIEHYLREKKFQNFQLVEGDINQTLPAFLAQNPQARFSLVHVDVDVYEPTQTILTQLSHLIVRGGLLVFDDYGTVAGETKAIEDFNLQGFGPLRKLPISHIPCFMEKL
ncbi:MAG: TylF/MycF family methyltransferase [Bernardetiaceae bacterium]|jgi:hypothetical protein|nr:TylF/MycF family methyltransferase [Bernardetiaceae bacterium]